jgi:ABC-2 type transport system permease protein
MTPRDVAARDPDAGAIYDLGYRGYDGPRLGRSAAVWTLYVSSLRAIFGLGRSARSKIIPWGAIVFASLPAVVQAAIIATAGPIASQVGVTYDNLTFQASILAIIFLAAQAPELLGSDQRHRVLALYFAHALERLDYAVAKFGAMVTGLFILAIVPLLILFLGLTFASTDLVSGFREQLGHVPQILGTAVIWAVLLSAIGMAIAAFTPRRAYATAAIVAVFLVGTGLQGLLRRAGERIGEWPILLDPQAVAEGVRHSLFGGSANGPVASSTVPAWGYELVAAAIVLVGLAVFVWRYRRIEA